MAHPPLATGLHMHNESNRQACGLLALGHSIIDEYVVCKRGEVGQNELSCCVDQFCSTCDTVGYVPNLNCKY